MASLSPSPKMQFFDSNGVPLAGGKLYTYAAGTTTPHVSYTDSTGVTPNTNPIILDSRGEANVWLTDGLYYAYKLTTSADVLIWTADNIGGLLTPQAIHSATSKTTPVDADEIPLADSAATFALKKLTWANLKATLQTTLPFLQSGTGAVATTVQAKLRERVSVKDFGAVGDGITDDTASLQAFFTYLSGLYNVSKGYGLIPAGNYLVTSPLTWAGGTNVQHVEIECNGRIVGNFANPILTISTALLASIRGLLAENTSVAAGAKAVSIVSTYTATFYDCAFVGGEYGMSMQGNSVKFIGCRFTGATNGAILTGAANLTSDLFIGCSIEFNTAYGIVFDSTGAYGKQAIKNCYFEGNPSGHILVNNFGHSLDIEQNHFSFNSAHAAVLLGAVGGGTAFSIRVRDNYSINNGAYSTDMVKQVSTVFMRGVRVSGNAMAGAGTPILYANAPYCINETAGYYPVNINDSIFATGTGWTSGGGTAPTYNVATISPYGIGKSFTKVDQYIYQLLTVKANTLYRVTCWAQISAGTGTCGVMIYDNPIVNNQAANIFGTTSTTATTPTLLEFYWYSGALTAANILLRQLAGTGTINFSDLRVTDVTNGAAY